MKKTRVKKSRDTVPLIPLRYYGLSRCGTPVIHEARLDQYIPLGIGFIPNIPQSVSINKLNYLIKETDSRDIVYFLVINSLICNLYAAGVVFIIKYCPEHFYKNNAAFAQFTDSCWCF